MEKNYLWDYKIVFLDLEFYLVLNRMIIGCLLYEIFIVWVDISKVWVGCLVRFVGWNVKGWSIISW